MPRSASTSKRSVSSGRGRFQPQPMESELERTPVLFRLPKVELPPPAPESSSTEDLQPTEEYQDDYQTPPEDFESEFVALPRRSQLDLPVADNAEPARQKSRDSQVEATTKTSASAEEEKPGSWWEHWSSGVVLILLIIALVTASIIAFNDAQQPEPDLLAEDGKSQEFSLSEIVIPEMQADPPDISKDADSAAISTSMVPPLSLPTQLASKPAQQETRENTNLLRDTLPGLTPNSPAAPAASKESQLANQPPVTTPDSSAPSMSLSENLQFSEPTPALPSASADADAVATKENNSSVPGLNANSVENSNQPGEGLILELPPLGQQDSLLLPPLAEVDNNKPQNVDLTNLEPAMPEPQLPADTTVASATPRTFPAIPETPAPTYDSILKLPIPSVPAAGNVQTVSGGPADAQFSITGHRTAATATQPQHDNTPPPNSPATSSSFAPASSPPGLKPEGTAQIPTGNQTTRTASPKQQNNTPELRRTATAEGNEDAIIRAWQSFRPSSNRYQ
ncbi:MAG: hypothetical protein VXZ82_19270 [Planctomycetota bacterium]|nr:hypothetical protein [Planctomycetota bacterium]